MSSRPVTYADYLKIEGLLCLQDPKSTESGAPAHDEMLFIIVHQAHELWFKQILHEIGSVVRMFSESTVDEKNMGVCVSRLERVTDIQKLLIDHIRVLATMTPLDFLEFRDLLTPASGFQSVQFRKLELTLGLSSQERFGCPASPYVQALDPSELKEVSETAAAPSLFSLVEKWLERTPFLDVEDFTFWKSYRDAVTSRLAADAKATETHPLLTTENKARQLQEIKNTALSFEALFDEEVHAKLVTHSQRRLSLRATHAALFINLYRDQPILHMPFRMLTLLVDIDELLQTWRAQHALMVHRMIGVKIGTGGSLGYPYLKSTIDRSRIFTDFSNLSTFLIPRSALPELPREVKDRLAFAFNTQQGR
jgi:tryptophan 2,3-dioxygenase